ncbi:hypothetical protein HPB52_011242 [Rhipicephalus sanguineus]|uniref:Uncharacterized protein n=1 Tax=Rhipicephalus sanguineus TaxID=34632 RepID=A0A9D4SSX7_RHISA|nr:hypothetical protein HPB52_011242 [Rhipicephalus sanguineus]
MQGVVAFALVSLVLPPVFVVSKLGAPGGPLKYPREEFDVKKVMEAFDDLVSVSDADNDTIFECLYAKRTNFNPETYETTYVWFFPSQGQLKDNVPQDCIDHFVDTCGVMVPQHSRDLCPDGEGDY